MINLEKAIALWFMDVSDTSNFLAAISRTDEGKLLFQWRIRYYKAGSSPYSDDKRNWYEGIMDSVPESEAIEKVRTVARVLTQHAKGPMHELIRGNKSEQQFFEELQSMSFAHIRPARPDEIPR